MILAHKIALNPNNVQATYFCQAVGTVRFAYNQALIRTVLTLAPQVSREI